LQIKYIWYLLLCYIWKKHEKMIASILGKNCKTRILNTCKFNKTVRWIHVPYPWEDLILKDETCWVICGLSDCWLGSMIFNQTWHQPKITRSNLLTCLNPRIRYMYIDYSLLVFSILPLVKQSYCKLALTNVWEPTGYKLKPHLISIVLSLSSLWDF